MAGDVKGHTMRCRASQFDGIAGGDGARCLIIASVCHDGHRCGPIAVAIEQCTDDSTIDHARERLMMVRSLEGHFQAILEGEGANLQPVGIGRATSEADAVRGMLLLHAFPVHAMSRKSTPIED